MRQRHIGLAILFGLYSAIIAILVNVAVLAIMGTNWDDKALFSAIVLGVCIFISGLLTVLVVWPRVGFDPFESHKHKGA